MAGLSQGDDDRLTGGLRDALAGKEAAVKAAWAGFEGARKEAEAKGLMADSATVTALDGRYKGYESLVREAEDLRDRYVGRLEGGSATKQIPGAQEGKLDGLGAEFLRRIGASIIGLKALDGTSGGTAVPSFFDPRIRDLPQRQLFVRSLIPVVKASGDRVDFVRQSAFTNAAAPVSPGGLKPTSTITVERVTEPVVTIAHVSEAIDRALLADFDALVDFIDGTLRLGVLLAEEQQIISGSGTPPNLRGILNTSGINSITKGAGEPRIEALHRGISACRAAFHEPDAIVMNPADHEELIFERDANGRYLSADVSGPDPTSSWGKPVITSPVMSAGTAIVGAFAAGATVWDREEARVTFTEVGLGDAAGQELYSRNQVRFRAEERIAFGVVRAAAFTAVTL